MSFVKIPRKYASRPQYGHNTKRKKKPQWDDTINDLSVHKATMEELERRKEATTSKNMDLVKADVIKKKINRSSHHHHRSGRTPGRKRKTALLKEVLYDSSQLQDVLSKSDRMMNVVRDLFGDDPMKYQGLPHVTSAPNRGYCQSYDNTLPDGSIIEEPSKLDMLSESIMDKSALNEMDSEYSDSDYEDVTPSYHSKLDLGRFQQLLTQAEAELEKDKKKQQSRGGGDSLKSGSSSMAKELAEILARNPELNTGRVTPTTAVELTSPVSAGPGAINDTLKVKKTMSRLTEQEKSSIISADTSNHNEGSFNLDSLRKVLSGLENNVHAYEKMTGRQPQVKKGDDEDGNTLTGFTGRLVSAVNKVSRYLKENELRLKAETTLREQLHSDVIYLKTLVDTLTNDIITTQEQYISLQSEFLSYRNETMDQLKAIKQGLESRGIQIHPVVFPVPQKPAVFPSAHAELLPRSNLGSNTMQMHDAILNHEHFDEGLPKNTWQQSSSRETSSMKPFDDQTGINSMNGSVQSAVALGLPQQRDSPKTMGKQRSRIQDDQSSTMAHPKRISYINQSSNTQEMSNGQTTQLSYSQQPLYDHLRQAGAVTVSERNPYLVKNNENNAGAFQPLLSDSQRFSDSGIRGTVDVSGIQGSFQNKPGNWSGTVHMEGTGTGLLQGTGTGLLHLSEQKPITSLPQHNVGSNLAVEPTLRSFELEAMARTGFENVGHSNINQPKSSGEKLTADIPTEMSSHLEKQIEELNKQHAEAQSKLQQLMYQQEVVENKMSTKNQQLVSPPISPITVESDADSQPSLSQHSMCQQYTARNVPNSAGYQQQHKQIRVSLPRMENIIDNQS